MTNYSYFVFWSPRDEEYVATVEEYPSLSWLAGTPQKALKGLVRIVENQDYYRPSRKELQRSVDSMSEIMTSVIRACRENPSTTTPADILRIIFPVPPKESK